MVDVSYEFASDEAEKRFHRISEAEKSSLIEIRRTLKKDFRIYCENSDSIQDTSETKLYLNDQGHVTSLFIGWNQLSELPLEVSNLEKLKTLYAQANQLKFLPEFWEKLSDLKQISLSNNEIEDLPESMENLKKLEKIDISYNQLGSIPDLIIHWNEAEVELSNNPIEYFAWGILQSTCICYFTQDAPKMGIGYYGDTCFVGISDDIWVNALEKYSGYRSDAVDVWNLVKKQLKTYFAETKERILTTLKQGEYLDYLDFYHPHFENWVTEIKDLCKKLQNDVAKQVLQYLEETY